MWWLAISVYKSALDKTWLIYYIACSWISLELLYVFLSPHHKLSVLLSFVIGSLNFSSWLLLSGHLIIMFFLENSAMLSYFCFWSKLWCVFLFWDCSLYIWREVGDLTNNCGAQLCSYCMESDFCPSVIHTPVIQYILLLRWMLEHVVSYGELSCLIHICKNHYLWA
jgi:hypothetical protein